MKRTDSWSIGAGLDHAGVHNVFNSIDGNRCLSNVGGQNNLEQQPAPASGARDMQVRMLQGAPTLRMPSGGGSNASSC
jgi:hypothetical protein